MKLAFVVGALILQSCSHTPKKSLLKLISKDPEASFKTYPANSPIEARRIIQNKFNFLRMLFEQSYDPYYGKPKWAENCLKANTIGSIIESEESIYLHSKLILKDNKEGFCPEDKDTVESNVLMVFCKNSSAVQEYRFSQRVKFDPGSISLCTKN